MSSEHDNAHAFLSALGRPFAATELFDAIPDTVFFVKDVGGRYVAVNQTLVARTGKTSKRDLIGRTAADVFPGALGSQMAAQDRAVLQDGTSISARLELHLYADGSEGWCLTWKEPLHDRQGRIIGLTGISRDLQMAASGKSDLTSISRVIDHIHAHLTDPMPLATLANLAGLTQFQLDQRMRGLFGISTAQFQTRARINHACNLLRSGAGSIAQVALDCGYGDQAAFTRAFRKSVGLTPSQYQKRVGG